MKKTLSLILAFFVLLPVVCACSSGTSQNTEDEANIRNLAGLFVKEFSALADKGDEYAGNGFRYHAAYAYGTALASAMSMRYAVDCLIFLNGEGDSLDEITDGRESNWDMIAAYGYASPYPWYFEGLVYDVQGMPNAATECYANALLNPMFDSDRDGALMLLRSLTVNELKDVRKDLAALEDRLLKTGIKPSPAIRTEYNFDAAYFRALAADIAAKDDPDYYAMLAYFENALAVDPFTGDNYLGCALMSVYTDDLDKAYEYVNCGLFADPSCEGLKKLAGEIGGKS